MTRTSHKNIRLIKKNEVDGSCGTQRRQERCIQRLGGEPERKRSFGRCRSRWQDKFGLKRSGVRRSGLNCSG